MSSDRLVGCCQCFESPLSLSPPLSSPYAYSRPLSMSGPLFVGFSLAVAPSPLSSPPLHSSPLHSLLSLPFCPTAIVVVVVVVRSIVCIRFSVRSPPQWRALSLSLRPPSSEGCAAESERRAVRCALCPVPCALCACPFVGSAGVCPALRLCSPSRPSARSQARLRRRRW
jgi:hypothetical protein